MSNKNKLPSWANEIKKEGGVSSTIHWEPEPGDILVGTVAGYREFEGTYGKVDIITIQTDKDAYTFFVSHKVLKQELRKWSLELNASNPPRLDTGTEIAIEYLGTLKSKEGNSFQGYNVYARSITPF